MEFDELVAGDGETRLPSRCLPSLYKRSERAAEDLVQETFFAIAFAKWSRVGEAQTIRRRTCDESS